MTALSRRFRAAKVLALCLAAVGGAAAHHTGHASSGMTGEMGSMDMMSSPGAMAHPPASAGLTGCYAMPSMEHCATFEIPEADIKADIATLCSSMPDMTDCQLWEECQENAAVASAPLCHPFSILEGLCTEMPDMTGCERYEALCEAPDSIVEQCTSSAGAAAPAPAPGPCDMAGMGAGAPLAPAEAPSPETPSAEADPLAPLTGCYLMPTMAMCTDFEIPENVILANVTTLCTSMPDMTGCIQQESCSSSSGASPSCAPFAILSSICEDMPSMNGCQGYNALCATPGTVVEQCS